MQICCNKFNTLNRINLVAVTVFKRFKIVGGRIDFKITFGRLTIAQ